MREQDMEYTDRPDLSGQPAGVTSGDGTPGRLMFADTLPEYVDLPQRALSLLIKDRKPIRKLLDEGYKKVGNLRGISEATLEKIVGSGFMPRFYVIERNLGRKPENWLPEIWKEDIDSRRGQIVMKTVLGQPRNIIASEEGVSGERIRQMTEKFFLGQDPFLEIVDDKIMSSGEQEDILLRLFPDETDRGIFLVWKQLKRRKRSGAAVSK